MLTITRADLGRLCPRPHGARGEVWDGYATALEQMAPEIVATGIDTPLILCHALAQWGAETGYAILWESGNYSAPRILEMFGKGRHSAAVTPREAAEIAALPTANDERGKALFERIYGLGNPKKARELGNTEPGDGWKYRGFGPQQVTGRTDHVRYFRGDYSALSALRGALMEWKAKGCSAKAAADDCRGVTRLINGGYNGLAERETLLRQAKVIWLEADETADSADAGGHLKRQDEEDIPVPRLADTLMPTNPGAGAPLKTIGKAATAAATGLGYKVLTDPPDADDITAALDKIDQAQGMFDRVGGVFAKLSPLLDNPMAHVMLALFAAGALSYAWGHRKEWGIC